MALEIERKFLVVGEDWKKGATGRLYRQGYLSLDPERSVRVRLVENEGWLTVKGASTGGTREEFEYPIPEEDAQRLLDALCHRPLIEKRRYRIRFAEHLWEVDEFFGENQGLVLAEVELREAGERVELPDWVGLEVTDDPRYFNLYLSRHPYATWAGEGAD